MPTRRLEPTARAGCMRSTTPAMGGSSSDTRPWGGDRGVGRDRGLRRGLPGRVCLCYRARPPSAALFGPARAYPRGGPSLRRAARLARRPRGRGQRVRPPSAGQGPPEPPRRTGAAPITARFPHRHGHEPLRRRPPLDGLVDTPVAERSDERSFSCGGAAEEHGSLVAPTRDDEHYGLSVLGFAQRGTLKTERCRPLQRWKPLLLGMGGEDRAPS
jgi:hypothetical protein